MKKALWLATLFLAGCGGPPKSVPMDGAAVAQAIVDGKSASSPRMLVNMNLAYARRLLEDERYAELDGYLDRLEKSDSIETLSSPTLIVLRLADLQDVTNALPWLLHYSGRWGKSNPRGWALMAAVVAFTQRGDRLMDVVGRKHYPLFEQGQMYFQQGTQLAAKASSGTKGWPYLDYINRLSSDSWAIISAIKAHPEEVALYQVLANVWRGQTRETKLGILKRLEEISPSSYALFFTFHLPITERGKIASENWNWELLKKGFEELLAKHPKALGVRNAYGVAAHLFSDAPVLQKQMAILGYQWDPYYWESLAKYQSARGELPDYHAARSDCDYPAPDAEAVKNTTVFCIENQARDLFEREQWDALESLAGKAPENWKGTIFYALGEPWTKNELLYRRHEAALRNWQTARPDSPIMMSSMGAFYIAYAWLARGSGYANTVTEKGWKGYEERLALGEKFATSAYREGPQQNAAMHTLMQYYIAKGMDRETADKLALVAAKQGRFGLPTLYSYALYLLPRWHGEPGDLVKAADQLRSQTGNDDAYSVVAETAMEYEGDTAFEAKDPMGMSYERWVASLEAGRKAGRTPIAPVVQFLNYASVVNLPKLARRLGTFLPAEAEVSADWSVAKYHALRRWALGEIENPYRPNPLRYDASTPRRQSAKALTKMGFRARLDHAPPLGEHYVMEVHCPPIQADDGTVYKRFTLFLDILPEETDTINCYLEPSRPDEFVPGQYTMALVKDRKVVHEEKFELTP